MSPVLCESFWEWPTHAQAHLSVVRPFDLAQMEAHWSAGFLSEVAQGLFHLSTTRSALFFFKAGWWSIV